ncbi:predicted protein [Chaetomium globosum CBS 148.51]|uniref:Uncharacterized protein n=1 Tax=Chaetomium globosum (strain ATCC 6205 / CBS 148.51 / DSM 1962 / NBRC 6347 / NRRL 1970) TaxID=306901 RepID=Q2GZP5_CHAGB|nr:uncharacterized protein CHGG_05001 [Chaetomium globosum CBS 148.51]EAQ88382.1 predicted protein [Chaetomium globosum CBS 148.51]
MARGKWRERIRRARRRLLRRQGQCIIQDSPTFAPYGQPFQQASCAPNDPHIPVIQIGPNQPSYYYPPLRLQDNLRRYHTPHQSTFDLTLPIPPSGISQRYPTRSSPKGLALSLKSLSLKGSSIRSSSPKTSSPKTSSAKTPPSAKTSSSTKTSISDYQPDQPKPKTSRSVISLLSSRMSTKTQHGSLHSSRWSFGSNRTMRSVRPDISHFTADDTNPSPHSGMTPPKASAGPIIPPRLRRPSSLSGGRGQYLPTPPPTPPLSSSDVVLPGL